MFDNLDDSTISYEQGQILFSKYLEICKSELKPTESPNGFMSWWAWEHSKRSDFNNILKSHRIIIRDKLIEKLHGYELHKSGFSRLSELSKNIGS